MANFQPTGWPTVTPRIVVADPDALVRFLKQVFDAKGEVRSDSRAVIRIGDSTLMVSGGGQRELASAFLYVYVEDADQIYRRAIAANAISLEAPLDTPYGDRRAMVRDAWGNTWQTATCRRHVR